MKVGSKDGVKVGTFVVSIEGGEVGIAEGEWVGLNDFDGANVGIIVGLGVGNG